MDGKLLAPSDATVAKELVLTNRTIAELSTASGYYPQLIGNEAARSVELMHEASLLTHDIVMYDVERVSSESWKLKITNPMFMEEHFFNTVPMANWTKMALARRIQLRDGLHDGQRDMLYLQTKQALLDQLAN